jgi:hypothetical protein
VPGHAGRGTLGRLLRALRPVRPGRAGLVTGGRAGLPEGALLGARRGVRSGRAEGLVSLGSVLPLGSGGSEGLLCARGGVVSLGAGLPGCHGGLLGSGVRPGLPEGALLGTRRGVGSGRAEGWVPLGSGLSLLTEGLLCARAGVVALGAGPSGCHGRLLGRGVRPRLSEGALLGTRRGIRSGRAERLVSLGSVLPGGPGRPLGSGRRVFPGCAERWASLGAVLPLRGGGLLVSGSAGGAWAGLSLGSGRPDGLPGALGGRAERPVLLGTGLVSLGAVRSGCLPCALGSVFSRGCEGLVSLRTVLPGCRGRLLGSGVRAGLSLVSRRSEGLLAACAGLLGALGGRAERLVLLGTGLVSLGAVRSGCLLCGLGSVFSRGCEGLVSLGSVLPGCRGGLLGSGVRAVLALGSGGSEGLRAACAGLVGALGGRAERLVLLGTGLVSL